MIADRTAYTGKLSDTFGYKFTNGLYARSDSTSMNAPKLFIFWSVTFERDRPTFSTSRSQWITERNATSARLIVGLKKLTFAFSATCFCSVLFVATRYIKTLKGQIGTCLLETRWYTLTFSPVQQPWELQCTVLRTDRQTDGQTDYTMMPI